MINIGRVLRQTDTEQKRESFQTERTFAMVISEATNSERISDKMKIITHRAPNSTDFGS